MEKILRYFTFILMGIAITGCPEVPNGSVDSESGGAVAASGECAEDEDCEEMCDDIFKRRADKEKCLETLPIRQVELLKEIHEILSEPSEDDLESINLDDLQVLLDISVEPAETLAGKMNATEAKKVLTWLAKSDEAVEVVKKKDKEFKVFKALLGKLNSNVNTALGAPISKGDNFIEVAVDESNDKALDWVHSLFEEDCDDASNYNKCIFKDHYCHLDLKDDAEEYYLGHESFEGILEEVLENARPTGVSWWSESTDIDDIDTWLSAPHDVCGMANFS